MITNCVKDIIEDILHATANFSPQAFVISIGGESGSGKTTLSNIIKYNLEQKNKNTFIIHQDEYFKLPPKQNHKAREKNFEKHIGPQEVDFGLLNEHIDIIKNRKQKTLIMPIMDWAKDERLTTHQLIEGTEVLIVEGTYTSILENIDKKIFIDASHEETLNRRVKRNREEVTEFISKVLHRERELIQAQKKFADIILDAEFNKTN